MIVYGIDPGTYKSALVGINEDYKVVKKIYDYNEVIEKFLEEEEGDVQVAVEFIQSYGMAVGRETFITVRWVGRFERAYDSGEDFYKNKFFYYARPTIRSHVCSGVSRVKDKDVRAALIMRLGEAKKGHPLEGIKKHLWSALAVAVTHLDGSKIGAENWMNLSQPKEKNNDKKSKRKRKKTG